MATLGELMEAILNIIPGAAVGEDNDGQIIIYTNKKLVGLDDLIDFEEGEEPE
jgi:uncharacterized protein (DUF1499 family)